MCPEPFDKLRTAPVEGHWMPLRQAQRALRETRDLAGGEPGHHHVTDHGAEMVAVLRRGQVAAEQVVESVLVGDLEDAVRADHQMNVHRVDVGPELPGGTAPRQQRVQPGDHRRRQRPQRVDPADELASMDVLDRHQPDEVGVLPVMVVGQPGQLPEGVDRSQVIDGEVVLRLTDRGVGLLQNGEVELFLAAEVVVDHAFRGAGTLSDFIDSGAGVSVLGKHLG